MPELNTVQVKLCHVKLYAMTPNLRLEAYAVFTIPADDASRIAFLKLLPKTLERLTIHPDSSDPMLTRAIALQSDTHFDEILGVFTNALVSQQLRWLEIGLHGYGIIKQSVEYRPWLRNRYLNLEAFGKLRLTGLEPEVRYHAPEAEQTQA
jgi:hypothetical protein